LNTGNKYTYFRWSLGVFLILFTKLYTYGQQLIPERRGSKWVYIDRETGQEKLTDLQMAKPLIAGVGIFIKDGKWGAIDEQGKLSIPLAYNYIQHLAGTIFSCRKQQNWQLYGIPTIPFEREFISANLIYGTKHLFMLQDLDRNFGIVDTAGTVVVPFEFTVMPKKQRERLILAKEKDGAIQEGLYTLEGQQLVPHIYKRISMWNAHVYIGEKSNGERSLLDKQGKVLIAKLTEQIMEADENFIITKTGSSQQVLVRKTAQRYEGDQIKILYNKSFVRIEKENATEAICSNEGKFLTIPVGYHAKEIIHNKIHLKPKDNAQSPQLIDLDGKVWCPPIYDIIERWTDRYALVVPDRQHRKYGLYAFSDDELKLPAEYDYIYFYHYGYFQTSKGDTLQFLDENFQPVTPPVKIENQSIYYATKSEKRTILPLVKADIPELQEGKEVLIIPMDAGKVEEIRKENRQAVGGLQRVMNFYERVNQYKSYANSLGLRSNSVLIDKRGKLLSNVYERVGKYRNGFIQVHNIIKIDGSDKKQLGFINTKGEEVIPLIYDDIVEVNADYMIVQKYGLRGVINLKGETILPIQYENIRLSESGHFYIQRFQLWGIAQLDGSLIVQPQYDTIDKNRTDQGYFKAQKDQKTFFLDHQGEVR